MGAVILAVGIFGVQYVGIKEFSRRYFRGTLSYMHFEMWYLGIAGLILALWKGISLPQSMATGICALLFGAGISGAFYYLNNAFSKGPMSTASMIMTLAILAPIGVDVAGFGKRLNGMQILALLLLGIGFAVLNGGKAGRGFAARYIKDCILAAVWNGIMLSSISLQQRLCQGREQTLFLALGLLAGAVVSAVSFGVKGRAGERGWAKSNRKEKIFWLLSVIVALATLTGNLLNIQISNQLPSVIQFPCVIGGGILFNMISARIIYGEKIEPGQWAGFFLCIMALICINQ